MPEAYSIEYSYEKFIFIHCVVVYILVFFPVSTSDIASSVCILLFNAMASSTILLKIKIENAFLWSKCYRHCCTRHYFTCAVCTVGLLEGPYEWIWISLFYILKNPIVRMMLKFSRAKPKAHQQYQRHFYASLNAIIAHRTIQKHHHWRHNSTKENVCRNHQMPSLRDIIIPVDSLQCTQALSLL